MTTHTSRTRSAILVSKKADTRLRERIRDGDTARVDYLELADYIDAEIIDFNTVEASKSQFVQWATKHHGFYWGMTALVLQRRKEFDHIYASAEDIGLHLAMVATVVRNLRFSLVVHNGGTPKRSTLFRLLGSHMYHRLFCLCEAQYKVLTEKIGLPRDKVRLINYCCDHTFFRPLKASIGDYILSIGIEQRDYHTLQQAAAMVPYSFRVVASGWSSNTEFTAARGVEGGGNIVVERNISSHSLKELYASARFIVVPLKHTAYAAGITTITEAMAMGKAVIVSGAPGVLDYVKDGVSGLVVPVGDAHALQRAITYLWERPELVERMGAHNRRWIEESFTIEQYVDNIVKGMNINAGTMALSSMRS